MKQNLWIIGVFGLLCVGALVLLISWPAYRTHKQAAGGIKAAELGAQLAFLENQYRARNGQYTTDFARLARLDKPLACPVAGDGADFICYQYRYYVEKDSIWARHIDTPEVFFRFDLGTGEIDCSHAPERARQAPLCSAWE